MVKDNQAKVGRTPCDLCDRPSVKEVDGKYLCDVHSAASAGEKQAATSEPSMKEAGEALAGRHFQ